MRVMRADVDDTTDWIISLGTNLSMQERGEENLCCDRWRIEERVALNTALCFPRYIEILGY